ncbi:CDK5 regulatory subunit-associated protein 2 isoform X1 [Pieris napi]|uniref:CDK5 regulatory subunit-associated protein 2 isoform X1 n=1 Tax=Pieris napi TaxID=78633 RepID=UPI001FB8DA73|nr:CDK5 regulatory subunit-associated protein 2 isoform X1 [Pieris napi]
MATLPRVNNTKNGNSSKNVASPFSSSPRKLPEMAPYTEIHDVTSASGVSLKQYEEQLNALRKENFQLKLRVYFLEENLGHGCPPAVQGLLEHNVRLQVEVEELKRQLSDKQALLAAAAEAIDVLENQGSLSTETAEASMHSNPECKQNEITQCAGNEVEKQNETGLESESAGEYLAVTVNNDDLDQMTKLKRENRKALQMIKECLKKIQQQNKEIKRLKLDKELTYAHVSDSQLEKYEGIIKCKDEHINELENKLRQFQNNSDNVQTDSGNLQKVLTKRLQEMALFLDKLLSHKCVLGEEKKKLAESILEQSLALPVGLKLDESMALGDMTMDESNIDMSQSMRLEDLTLMFGHHMTCNDENRNSRNPTRSYPRADAISESECWSEPDRNVSLARVGLSQSRVTERERDSESVKHRSRRSRISFGSRSEDGKANVTLLERVDDLTQYSQELEEDNKELAKKLDAAMEQIVDLEHERDDYRLALETERSKIIESNSSMESLKKTILVLESRINENEQQIAYNDEIIEKLRAEKSDLEVTFLENERSLRRAADEATVQASQAALERARAQHERLRVERELEETREKLSSVMEAQSQLEMELTRRAVEADNKVVAYYEGQNSEEDRPTSPDQGIDSDRLSSLEHDAVNLSPRSLLKENVTLKQKLARTKATLAETLTQLNAANMMKRNAQRAICRQIHKTQGVLRRARDQFEQHNN